MNFDFIKSYGLSKEEQITLVQTYVIEILKSFQELETALQNKDSDLARLYSHKIQGSSEMMGLSELAKKGKAINTMVHADDWSWEDEMQEIKNVYPEIARVSEHFCSSLNLE